MYLVSLTIFTNSSTNNTITKYPNKYKMNCMKLFTVFLGILFVSCNGQSVLEVSKENSNTVGGGCEGCELMYVEIPDEISNEHTSLGWFEGKQKLIITGTVFQLDGKTPAANTLIYYWHTDDAGLYSSNEKTSEKVKAHGKLRGWIKTDSIGKYTIKTSRPASYPNEDIPQHIHLSIKEPNITNEYFADLYFDDDKLYLAHKKKYGKIDRAGSEILRVLIDNEVQIAEHDIILGLNIPHYPSLKQSNKFSGLNIGEDQPSFTPYHAFGADKGTQTCPVCKYGRYHGIIYFVGNHPNWNEIKTWLIFLDNESRLREKYLKTYFVLGNEKEFIHENTFTFLESLGKELNLQNIALTFVPSFNDSTTEVNLNKINAEVENTMIIYKHRTIVDKYINLLPTKENFAKIINVLDKTKGNYFNLEEPKHD